jgi:hypothetical protein
MRTLDILGFVEGNGDQTPAVRVGAIVPLFLMQRMPKNRILRMDQKWLAHFKIPPKRMGCIQK